MILVILVILVIIAIVDHVSARQPSTTFDASVATVSAASTSALVVDYTVTNTGPRPGNPHCSLNVNSLEGCDGAGDVKVKQTLAPDDSANLTRDGARHWRRRCDLWSRRRRRLRSNGFLRLTDPGGVAGGAARRRSPPLYCGDEAG